MPTEAVTYRQLVIFDSPDVSNAIVAWCQDEAHGVLLATREDADEKTNRTHYHIVVHHPEGVTTKTIRNHVKKLPGMSGNKTFETGEYDGGTDFLQYMCKGKKDRSDVPPVVIYNKTLHDPLDLHKAYHTVRTASPDAKVKNSHDVIAKLIKDNEFTNTTSRTQIIRAVLRHYRGKCHDLQVFSMVQGIEWLLDEDNTVSLACARIEARFSPR